MQTVVGDVSEEETVKRAITETLTDFGALDVLVANAGVIPEATLESATADLWDRTMSIDGRGTFLCCKYAAAAMEKHGKGEIVCLSSISGCAGQPEQAVYGPAKFVASGITKHLAVEPAPKGIRVNAVAPERLKRRRSQS